MSGDALLLNMSQSAAFEGTHFRRVQWVSVREVDRQSAHRHAHAQTQHKAFSLDSLHLGGSSAKVRPWDAKVLAACEPTGCVGLCVGREEPEILASVQIRGRLRGLNNDDPVQEGLEALQFATLWPSIIQKPIRELALQEGKRYVNLQGCVLDVCDH